ncbi:hypothetical protein GCM10017673_31360 [Streptosporangium violaceochromogenes]|nr:hypothetical protein GCM10017673_31360 [Streptosporangium violaceochromogenes]
MLGVVSCTPATPGIPDTHSARHGNATSAPSLPTTPAPPATVDCEAAIDGEQAPPSGFEIIGDAVALPTDRARSDALQTSETRLPDGKAGLFAKQGLLVRRGRVAELTVPENLRDRFWMRWGGQEPPGDHVVVNRCAAEREWLVFAGGYTVRHAACLPVDVRVDNGDPRRVRVGIGAPCPGQRPASQR